MTTRANGAKKTHKTAFDQITFPQISAVVVSNPFQMPTMWIAFDEASRSPSLWVWVSLLWCYLLLSVTHTNKHTTILICTSAEKKRLVISSSFDQLKCQFSTLVSPQRRFSEHKYTLINLTFNIEWAYASMHLWTKFKWRINKWFSW